MEKLNVANFIHRLSAARYSNTCRYWWSLNVADSHFRSFTQKVFHLPLAFTVRISSQKIYITTIWSLWVMSERITVIRVLCMVKRNPVICMGALDSLWQVHNFYSNSKWKQPNLCYIQNDIFTLLSQALYVIMHVAQYCYHVLAFLYSSEVIKLTTKQWQP